MVFVCVCMCVYKMLELLQEMVSLYWLPLDQGVCISHCYEDTGTQSMPVVAWPANTCRHIAYSLLIQVIATDIARQHLPSLQEGRKEKDSFLICS